MMNDQHVASLQQLFGRKMEEVYEKNHTPDHFGNSRIAEFNAWQQFLRSYLSLEVVDIEEGERPGFVRLGGQVVGMRIMNPSNATGHSREFIIVPYDFAERCLMTGWIPNERPPQDE